MTQDETLSIERTADIVAAYVRKNPVPAIELPALVTSVRTALDEALRGRSAERPAKVLVPAVPIKKSITPAYLISLEDGRKFKSLTRHLRTEYRMTPDQYRVKWGLPADYPVLAPNSAVARSAIAKNMLFGQRIRPKQ